MPARRRGDGPTRLHAVGPLGGAPGSGAPGSGAEARRPWPPRPFDVVLVVLVGWLVVCGLLLRRAAQAADDGLEAARAAEQLTSPADLLGGRTAPPLEQASAAFGRARVALRNPFLAPLRLLPVAGRQLRSSTALVSAAARVSGVGATAVHEAVAAFEAPHETGPQRVALLRRLAAVAGDARRRLDGVRLGPERALVATLAGKRAELAGNIGEVRDVLARAETVSAALAALLDGPSRYLVLAANNAEMRAGSGMFLSLGEATMAAGALSLGDFRPAGASTLAAGTEPAMPDADLAGRWGWLSPNREWRNLATSPRFDVTAALAAEMWAATGSAPVDGVLAIDPVAVRAILAATGPVEVGGATVSADDVVELLLHRQYAGLGAFDDQSERRDMLGSIAAAAITALQGPAVDLARLAEGLAQAARGRHLLAWSARPVEAGGWEAAQVTGQLGPDSLAVAVLNRGGNKLDRFLEVDADLELLPGAAGPADTAFRLEIRLANRVPAGESVYVAGPHPDSGVGGGVYLGLVSVNVPAIARDVTVDGQLPLAAFGPDGPTVVAAVPVTVPPGEDAVVTVRYTMPGTDGQVRVEPSARVPGVRWTGPDGGWPDGRRHTVRWTGVSRGRRGS